jgi:hypothetical protein
MRLTRRRCCPGIGDSRSIVASACCSPRRSSAVNPISANPGQRFVAKAVAACVFAGTRERSRAACPLSAGEKRARRCRRAGAGAYQCSSRPGWGSRRQRPRLLFATGCLLIACRGQARASGAGLFSGQCGSEHAVGVSRVGRLIRARGQFGGPGQHPGGGGVLRVRAHVVRPGGRPSFDRPERSARRARSSTRKGALVVERCSCAAREWVVGLFASRAGVVGMVVVVAIRTQAIGIRAISTATP